MKNESSTSAQSSSAEQRPRVTVEKLSRPEPMGDWHDKPLRWIVKGPNDNHQKFCTKRDANKFASVYRKSDSMIQAMATYARIPV